MKLTRVICLPVSIVVLACGNATTSGDSESWEKPSSGEQNFDSETTTDDSEQDSVVLEQAEVESTWVTVPAGQFVYGAPETQPCRGKYSDEQVEVIITHSFKMAPTEVTRRQWQMTGFPDPSSSFIEQCEDCPQGFVNWYDTMAWLNALSRAVGLPECYDLSDCTGTPSSGCPDEELYRDSCG